MSTLPTVAVERQAGDTASIPRQDLAGCLKIGDGAVEADRHPVSVHVTDWAVVPVEFFDKVAMNYGVAGRSHCKSPDKSSTTVSTSSGSMTGAISQSRVPYAPAPFSGCANLFFCWLRLPAVSACECADRRCSARTASKGWPARCLDVCQGEAFFTNQGLDRLGGRSIAPAASAT
jgi:hypothetical protein